MKNLSEKIGYFNTIATEQAIKDYETKYNTDNPYYIKLKEIINKQMEELQKISGLSKDAAKELLLRELDKQLTLEKV